MKVIVPLKDVLRIVRKHYNLTSRTAVFIEDDSAPAEKSEQIVADSPAKIEEKITGNFKVGFKT